MKTLFITSIYSDLYGTEFGGRASRFHHYRHSLLNILNMKPTKVMCFTSEHELPSLKDFFYKENNINEEILEFRSFSLSNSYLRTEINAKKNMEEMLKLDRCYEIQYNKLFWFDYIHDRFDYQRVYWIDAGLSYGHLFPEEYRVDKPDNYYDIKLFNPDTLDRLNTLSKNKIALVGKTNHGILYWSSTVPSKYYVEYDHSTHIVGGIFGGTPKKFENMKILFEKLLLVLLSEEDQLYMEEQILSCIYHNNKNLFHIMQFDDWYERETHKPGEYKYFYELFI